MSFLLEFLPIVIYILLIIILIIGIILAIKCLIALDKVEKVVDNVNEKIRALDSLFQIIETTSDKIVLVTNKFIEGLTVTVANLFTAKKKKKSEKTASKEVAKS